MTAELLPCPFCGGEARRAYIRATDDLSIWAVECATCEAERASDASQEEADGFWNTRSSHADASGSGVRETDLRIALWNVLKTRGMGDDAVYEVINKTVLALAALSPSAQAGGGEA